MIGPHILHSTDAHHFRGDHVKAISQQPGLFNVSITKEVMHSNPTHSPADIQAAAEAENVHSVLSSLPQ